MMTCLQWYVDPSPPPHQLKKVVKVGPLWKNFLDPRMTLFIREAKGLASNFNLEMHRVKLSRVTFCNIVVSMFVLGFCCQHMLKC